MDLALIDRRFLVIMVKLDRVFDRDDMMVHRFVDVVHQAGQRGAFSRPGRPGHQEQTARSQDHLGDHVRQAQFFRRQVVVGDLPQNHRDLTALLEHRDAETSHFPEGESEVGAAGLLQFALATLGRDALHQRHRVLLLQRLGFQFPHAAMQTKYGRLANHNVDIARPLLDARLQ